MEIKLLGLSYAPQRGGCALNGWTCTELEVVPNMSIDVNEDDGVLDVNYPNGSFKCFDRIVIKVENA